GIHSGPVNRVSDINARENAVGGGVNLAQRVMDCGDAGHILLSATAADFLLQLGGWEAHLHDLGECAVKHGKRLHLFNLRTEETGNAAVPERLGATLTPQPPLPSFRERGSAEPQIENRKSKIENQKVALLYKRNAEPDGYLLKRLETELRAEGFEVF